MHISELANRRVPTVEDVVNIGDPLHVLVTEIVRQGRINLSHRALLEPEEGAEESDGEGRENGDRERRPYGGRSNGGDRGGFRDRDRDRGPRREGGDGDRDRDRPRREEGERAPRPAGAGPQRERGSASGRRATMRRESEPGAAE